MKSHPIEPVYMNIENSGEIRRDLLTSSKNLLTVLKRYDAFTDLRSAKLDLILEVKRVIEEIAILEKRLRSKMPRLPYEESSALVRREEKTVVRDSKSKLELLESELARIEDKLKNLS